MEFTLHCVAVYRSKTDPSKYQMSRHTFTGKNMGERMETILEVETRSWSDKWELVAFSHAFLPFEVGYQI